MQTRAYRHLTAEERETVSLGLAQGHSPSRDGSEFGTGAGTLSRELARNQPLTPIPARPSSWIPGCGNTCGLIWGTAVRPNRSPDGSYASILRTCRSTALPKPFTPGCMYCRAGPYEASCWRRAGAKAARPRAPPPKGARWLSRGPWWNGPRRCWLVVARRGLRRFADARSPPLRKTDQQRQRNGRARAVGATARDPR
ncbi:MAG: helix-turn-helix domain-containing protein [Nitrospira sp.]|nr:helix-turn-helix domain-containing protein [Nitrospira sp.]